MKRLTSAFPASLLAVVILFAALPPADQHDASTWLADFVSRLDPASEPARAVAALGSNAPASAITEALASYFRGKPAPERLLTIPRPDARVAEFRDVRSDKALGHLITDREGEEQYGDDLPWFDANKKIVTLSRFPHFDYLAISYYHTADERYAAAMVRDMLDFVENVPVSKSEGFHVQMDLRSNPWNWVLLQWRVKRWIDALVYLRESPSLSDEQYLRILHHIVQEIEWLVPRKVLGLHNGTLGNVSAIVLASVTYPEFASASDWYLDSASFFSAFLDTAFYPAEFLVELTVGYSEGTLLMSLNIFEGLPDSPLRDKVAVKLEKLVDAHVGIMKPDRSLPRYGDHGAYDIRERILRKAARLFDRPDLRLLADDPALADASIPVTSFPQESDPYYLSGYYAMRDGWDEKANYLSIDAGPFGTNHHHGDKLSISVSADGAEFIVDPGTSLYRSISSGPRIDLRPGYHHNVITVDGVDPNTGWDRHYGFDVLDNRWVTNPTYDFVEGIYEYRNSLVEAIWRRSVLFRKGEYWILIDAVHGDGKHKVESNLQFMIGSELSFDGETTTATATAGAQLGLQRLSNAAMQRDVVVGDTIPRPSTFLYQYPTFVDWTRGGRGWVGLFGNESPNDPTRTFPAPALLHSGRVELPFYDIRVITPSVGGRLDLPRVSWIAAPGETKRGHFRLQIAHATGPVDVLDWTASQWAESEKPLADDSGFWYRVEDGHIAEVMFMNVALVEFSTATESMSVEFERPFEGVARRATDGSWSLYADSFAKSPPDLLAFDFVDEAGAVSYVLPRGAAAVGAWIPVVAR